MANLPLQTIFFPNPFLNASLEETLHFGEKKKEKKKKDKKKKKEKKCCKSYKKKDGKMCKDCPKMN